MRKKWREFKDIPDEKATLTKGADQRKINQETVRKR